MLTKFRLQNYRSCKDVEFKLQPDLSVLIGPNGSGKTNILSGLTLLKRLLEEDQFGRAQAEDTTVESKIKAWFDVGGKTVILSANVALYTDESNNDVVIESNQSWYVKDFTGSAKRLRIPLAAAAYLKSGKRRSLVTSEDMDLFLYRPPIYLRSFRRDLIDDNNEEAIKAIQKIANWVWRITYYSASQFTNPSACPVSIEVENAGPSARRTRARANTATRFLFDLYEQHQTSTDRYRDFVDIIGPNGIGLVDKLTFQELQTSSVDYAVRVGGKYNERRLEKVLVVPQFKIGRNTLSPNQLSEGTFKTIVLLFYMMTQVRTLLLLEEPEVCVHHGLLGSILELMKAHAKDQQVVISTHSDFVVDHVEPRSVYTVRRSPSGETSMSGITKSMSGKELRALKHYLDAEGSLGEYWKHGALD